jgi:hypothetical protein
VTAPLIIVAHPADPPAVTARRADRALEGSGVHVWYDSDNGTVWIMGRNRAIGDAEQFGPGQQLVVESSGAWRIENGRTKRDAT